MIKKKLKPVYNSQQKLIVHCAFITIFLHDLVVACFGSIRTIGPNKLGNPDLLSWLNFRLEHSAFLLREGFTVGQLNSPLSAVTVESIIRRYFFPLIT